MTRTITGNPDFDRQITGPADKGEKLRKEGSEKRPFAAGLFQTVTDIKWAEKKFCVVAGGGDFGLQPDNAFWAQFAGLSSDGLQWNNVISQFNFNEVAVPNFGTHIKCWFDACIRGKGPSDEPVVFIGGGKVTGDQHNQQMAFMTFDEGASFQDLEFPTKPPNETTTPGTTVVGYNKKEKTFYLSHTLLIVGGDFSQVVSRSYAHNAGGGWNLLAEVQAAQALTPWPQKTLLSNGVAVGGVDTSFPRASIGFLDTGTMTINNSDGDTFKIGINQADTVSILVNGAPRSVPRMNPVTNLAAGNGVILVSGPEQVDLGVVKNLLLRSDDFGNSWEEILQELKQGDQRMYPRPSFS